jgi:hypothetical protein
MTFCYKFAAFLVIEMEGIIDIVKKNKKYFYWVKALFLFFLFFSFSQMSLSFIKFTISKRSDEKVKQNKAKEELKKVIELFQKGEIGEYIALSYFPIPNIPCSKWSLKNRLIMNINKVPLIPGASISGNKLEGKLKKVQKLFTSLVQ